MYHGYHYYRMKIKSNRGEAPNTFFLSMWIGGVGTFFSLFLTAFYGGGFRGRVPVVGVLIVSCFYFYFLKILAEHYVFPRLLMLLSAAGFIIYGIVLGIKYSRYGFYGYLLGIICFIYYAGIFYFTRQCIRRKYFG